MMHCLGKTDRLDICNRERLLVDIVSYAEFVQDELWLSFCGEPLSLLIIVQLPKWLFVVCCCLHFLQTGLADSLCYV